MSSLFITPFIPALNNIGAIMPGATLTFYRSGTTELAAVLDDSGDELANPVVADAFGRFPSVALDDAITYRVVLKSSLGVIIGDADPYSGASSLDALPDAIDPPGATLTGDGVSSVANLVFLQDRAWADIRSRWWDGTRIWGQDGGYAFNNVAPFFWGMSIVHNIWFWRWRYLNDSTALSGIVSNATYVRSAHSDAVLGSATAENDVGASDDLALNLHYWRQVHQATGLSAALTIMQNLLASGRTVFASPDGGPYLLYAVDGAPVGHERSAACIETITASVALYLFQQTGDVQYKNYAIQVYGWVKQYLKHPYDICYNELDVRPTLAGTSTPNPHYLKPVSDQFAYDIRRGFSAVTLDNTASYCTLAAELYNLTGDVAYKNELALTIAGMVRRDTFVRDGDVFVNDRDGWVQGYQMPAFVATALSVPGVDPGGRCRQIVANTAAAAASMRTWDYRNNGVTYGSGLYGADWSGPEQGLLGTTTWLEQGNAVSPGIAKPEAIMTNGAAGSLIMAGRMTGLSNKTTKLVTADALDRRLNSVLSRKLDKTGGYVEGAVRVRDSIDAGGPIRRTVNTFFDVDSNGNATYAFSANDYLYYEQGINRLSFRINGVEQWFTTVGGTNFNGPIRRSTDVVLDLDGASTNGSLSLGSGAKVVFNATTQKWLFFTGGILRMTLAANGDLAVAGAVTPNSTLSI